MLGQVCIPLAKLAATTVSLLTMAVIYWGIMLSLNGCVAYGMIPAESHRWNVWCYCAAVTVSAICSTSLLYGASTPYLRWVACYAALIWAHLAVGFLYKVFCRGSATVNLWRLLLLLLPILVVVIAFFRLAYTRVAALEASALQPMGAATLRRLLRVLAVLGIACITKYTKYTTYTKI